MSSRASPRCTWAPGKAAQLTSGCGREDLAYWDTRVSGWIVEGGDYTVSVGASSRDIRATVQLVVAGDDVRIPLNMTSTMGEVMAHPVAGPIILAAMGSGETAGILDDPTIFKMMESAPIGLMASFPGSGVELGQLEQLLAMANAS